MPQISSWAMFLWPVYVALGCINALGSRECQRPKAWPISWAATWTRSFSHTPVQRQHAIQSKKNMEESPYSMFLLCDFWVQTFKIQSELAMNTLKHCFMNIYESFFQIGDSELVSNSPSYMISVNKSSLYHSVSNLTSKMCEKFNGLPINDIALVNPWTSV